MFGSRGVQFRLLGFPVRVEASFLVMAAILGIGSGSLQGILAWMVAVFVSVLLHELGHAVVVRTYGIRPEIVLYGMGGQTRYTAWRPLNPWQEIAISAAGPGIGLIVGAALWLNLRQLGAPSAPILRMLLNSLLWVNIVWSLLNLLPILPLDGGNIMASIMHLARGYRREELPLAISVICGVAVGLVALYFGRIFGTILVAMFTLQNVARFRAYGTGLTRSEVRVAQVVIVVLAALLMGGYWLLTSGDG
ncbi:MAG: hypothetical protein JXL80_17690 [Planctomycetes bacterium]|nr:hypothetical protein [Planctomycetota bacterium]